MMKTKLAFLFALLTLCLTSACALGATANAAIVAPKTYKLTAPYAGTLLPFDLAAGDSVSQGDTLFTLDAAPVYAAQSGTVSAVFAAEGDDAQGVLARYGALAVIEPEHALYIAADTRQAYDDDENRYIHAGETVYLKWNGEKGFGRVTSVNGNAYIVEILSGDFEPDDTVRCFRESNHDTESEIGRGKVMRYADSAVSAQGRIVRVHVQPGDTVRVGDVLFDVVDAQAAKDASADITAPANGAITLLAAQSGAQVYRGMLLAEVADLSALELSAEVDELDLTSIRIGDTLTYTLDAYGDETFSGTVTEIRPLGIRKQNATYFDVRMTLPEGKTLLPGMNATVTLQP